MTATTFALDPRLAQDTVPVADLRLCLLLLMDNARFPWLVLVPRRAGLTEITDLAHEERVQLMEETVQAMTALESICRPYKLNVAALGNQVRQLHVHVIARFEHDSAWPNPVWGRGEKVPYASNAKAELIERIREALG